MRKKNNNKVNGNGTIPINNYLKCNGLNAPTKRERLAEWIQKQYPYIFCLQETHLKTRDTYRLKVKGWKNIYIEALNQYILEFNSC